MKQVLVTGAHGQLGTELNFLSSLLETHSFTFAGRDDLDITEAEEVDRYLASGKFDLVINCAAYTAVDKAESEKAKAFKVNAEGAGNLARSCANLKADFIHISTDFVFDGTVSRPLLEEDHPNP